MICINLLPWRKAKLVKRSKNLFTSLLLMLIFSTAAVLIHWYLETADLQMRSQAVAQFYSSNQQVLNRIKHFKQKIAQIRQSQPLIEQLNNVSEQRHRVPAVLFDIAAIDHAGQLHYLLVDQQQIVMKGSFSALDSALGLFQVLSQHPALCQASFKPISGLTETNSTVVYEFQAQLCDEFI